jgi:hypothetical protein
MTKKGRALSESVTVARLKLLTKLKDKGAQKFSPRYTPLRWAFERGLVRQQGDLYVLTPEGSAKLSYHHMDAGLKKAIRVLPALAGKTLVRTASDAEEAVNVGGGYLYHTEPDHKPFPPGAARTLIANGLLVGRKDGLLDGIAQTFRLPSAGV